MILEAVIPRILSELGIKGKQEEIEVIPSSTPRDSSKSKKRVKDRAVQGRDGKETAHPESGEMTASPVEQRGRRAANERVVEEAITNKATPPLQQQPKWSSGPR